MSFLFFLMFILMSLSAWHKNLSYDEPHNLRYGYDVLTKGPLVETDGQRMPVFVLNALACKKMGCLDLENSPWTRFWVRFPTLVFTLALGLLIWHWTRKMFGPKAAMGASFLFVFNPTLLAHGKQVTSDVVTTFFVVLAVYFLWSWRHDRRARFFYACAVATGFAIVSKYSSVLLFVILPLIVVLEAVIRRSVRLSLKGLGVIILRSAAFAIIVWFVINAAYLFQGSFENIRSQAWQSRFYQMISKKTDFLVPLPRIFVRGLDYSHFISEHPELGRGNNYIFGHRHRKGRDYAVPAMILLKSPLAFFVLLITALVASIRKKDPMMGLSISELYLWLPFAVWLLFFSSFCDIQVGIRYVLPGYVFLIIYVGKAFNDIKTRRKAAVMGATLFWYVFSTLSYHPHYMSYFNEIVGDRINAYKYLADSNLDWEDKSYYIHQWEKNHPNIHAQSAFDALFSPKPGFYLLSANSYVGVFDEAELEWVREFKPLAQVTYSHLLVYAAPQEFAAARLKHPQPKAEK